MNSLEIDLRKLAEAIADADFVMFTTVDQDGSMHSRPMATVKFDPEKFNGRLYFFTRRDTQKVHSIEQDQHVNLAYALPKQQRFISVTGRGFLIEDRKLMRDLWEPKLDQWIPKGLEDPDLSLIAVDVESADLWGVPENKVLKLMRSMRKKKSAPYPGPASEHLNLNPPQ